MKAKKRPTKNGIYVYCIEGHQENVQIMHYKDGKYAYFGEFFGDAAHTYDINDLIDADELWVFWGPLNLTEKVA